MLAILAEVVVEIERKQDGILKARVMQCGPMGIVFYGRNLLSRHSFSKIASAEATVRYELRHHVKSITFVQVQSGTNGQSDGTR
jgi:hypothetical protein